MGLNTPAIILNDMVHELEVAPYAGAQIARALRSPREDPRACVGIEVLPPGHSSAMQVVAIGGNTLRPLAHHHDCHATDEDLLKALADRLDYRVAPKGSRDDLLKASKRALATLKAQGESVRPGNVLGALEAAIKVAEGRT